MLEERVDYVQVDEQKTQALQNTKEEWTDVRQSCNMSKPLKWGIFTTTTSITSYEIETETRPI